MPPPPIIPSTPLKRLLLGSVELCVCYRNNTGEHPDNTFKPFSFPVVQRGQLSLNSCLYVYK